MLRRIIRCRKEVLHVHCRSLTVSIQRGQSTALLGRQPARTSARACCALCDRTRMSGAKHRNTEVGTNRRCTLSSHHPQRTESMASMAAIHTSLIFTFVRMLCVYRSDSRAGPFVWLALDSARQAAPTKAPCALAGARDQHASQAAK